MPYLATYGLWHYRHIRFTTMCDGELPPPCRPFGFDSEYCAFSVIGWYDDPSAIVDLVRVSLNLGRNPQLNQCKHEQGYNSTVASVLSSAASHRGLTLGVVHSSVLFVIHICPGVSNYAAGWRRMEMISVEMSLRRAHRTTPVAAHVPGIATRCDKEVAIRVHVPLPDGGVGSHSSFIVVDLQRREERNGSAETPVRSSLKKQSMPAWGSCWPTKHGDLLRWPNPAHRRGANTI